MKLNLKRPIIFFDLETTGLDIAKDRIVELCYIRVEPNGNEEARSMRINPEMHIPEVASSVHGITDDDVKDCPTFADVAPQLAATFEGCDLAGFNSNRFDLPLLAEEFMKAGVNIDLSHVQAIDVQNIYHKLEKRTLAAAYKFYCGRDLENAHSALADTQATYEVLQAQLDHYPNDLQNDVDFLAEFSRMNRNIDFAGRFVYDESGKELINFGKYKGKAIKDVLSRDPGYYSWIMQGDFTLNTKQVLTKLRLKYAAR
ncbi:MAG: 3'-5' exonuclease [Bacteroidaceae bacterium]|nr:3'-5' exonuclease [Prevotellaceae bacterium]MDY5598351.1 3'-5' exonuclease [Bacteroidaceae bacterium]MDY5673662.1 3'-5' exonuclease [Bacteroidaceae bacterium]MEE1240768.1 3'-5' exonuclease [Bacteroidaceae bacterium]